MLSHLTVEIPFSMTLMTFLEEEALVGQGLADSVDLEDSVGLAGSLEETHSMSS